MEQEPVFLFAFANDRRSDGRYLRDLSNERKNILKILEPARRGSTIEVVDLPNATHDEICDILLDDRHDVCLFHFAGHAGDAELILETDDGAPAPAAAEGLATLLGNQSVELVFLNGCATQAHAALLLGAGVGAVVVTSEAIDDQVAARFASRFYQGLAAGRSIQRAFEDAQATEQALCGNIRKSYQRSFVPPKDRELVWPWQLFPGRVGDRALAVSPGEEATAVSRASASPEASRDSDNRDQRGLVIRRLTALQPVRESWWRLGTEPSGEKGFAALAFRQILGHLGRTSADDEYVGVASQLFSALGNNGADVLAPESLAKFYVSLGGRLSAAGDGEAALRAYQICRQIVEFARRHEEVTASLLAVYDELINREAVAMRDDFQLMMALAHLQDYRMPNTRPLLYEGVCALGTRAQLLSYLAERQREAGEVDAAGESLSEAKRHLNFAIGFLEKSFAHDEDLPREHNYLGMVFGASGDFEGMAAAFNRALDINDQQYRDRGVSHRDAWVENILYTFQLWLRACDLASADDHFRHVDRCYRAKCLGIVSETGDPTILARLEARYPGALICRYRARSWGRWLARTHTPELWQEYVAEPLLALAQRFGKERSKLDLACAVLVDLLLASPSREPRVVEWSGRLSDGLLQIALTSRSRWKGTVYDVDQQYRELFSTQLLELEAFREGRVSLSEMKSVLVSLRTTIGY